jgi:F0F1-type ATP synthase epsilon subunit
MAAVQEASTGNFVDDGTKKDRSGQLKIKIYAPFKTYYDSYAESITAENDTGVFDVLLGHKNFLTLLNPCDITVRSKGVEPEVFPISRGIMHVEHDKVTVFLDV